MDPRSTTPAGYPLVHPIRACLLVRLGELKRPADTTELAERLGMDPNEGLFDVLDPGARPEDFVPMDPDPAGCRIAISSSRLREAGTSPPLDQTEPV